MLKLPMDAIKNYHGCSQQCSHKIAGKYVSCTHLWILTAIASICVTSWGPCWLGATCKNVFHASSVKKKCIVLTSNCLVKVAKAKHLVAVWKIIVWYSQVTEVSRHTYENIVLQVKEIFYWLSVYGNSHDKLINVWQRSLALQPYSRFFW